MYVEKAPESTDPTDSTSSLGFYPLIRCMNRCCLMLFWLVEHVI